LETWITLNGRFLPQQPLPVAFDAQRRVEINKRSDCFDRSRIDNKNPRVEIEITGATE